MDRFSPGTGGRSDAPQTQRQAVSPVVQPGRFIPRSTRRAILAFCGLVAGGRVIPTAGAAAPRGSASARARLELAQSAMEAVRADIGRGKFNPGERDPIAIWSRRRMEARLNLSASRAERVAAAQEHLDEMKAVELLVAKMHEAGEIDRLTRMDAQYRRLEAESWLEQEKSEES